MGSEGYSGLPAYYLESSDPITPNIGFSLKGMDPIVAANFVLADSAITGGGFSVKINGALILNPNFNNTTPAAPVGYVNVLWQVDGSGNVSGYVPTGGGGTPGGSDGDIQYNNSGVFGGSATSINAAGSMVFPTGQTITDSAGNTISFQSNRISLFSPNFAALLLTTTECVFSDNLGDALYLNDGTNQWYLDNASGSASIRNPNGTNTIIVHGGMAPDALSHILADTLFPAVVISGSAPANGQILVATSGTTAQWSTPSGSGTVTSVSFTGDGTVLSSNPSTPVTTSGTLTATLNTQSANVVLAGPTTGGAANPTFRSLVAADLPAGTGTVTSFSSGNIGSIISTSVATATTTPALSFTLETQAANTVWAGPTTGSAAAPTFRALVSGDLPSGTGTVTSFSAGNLSPLFTTSVATATTTPALSFSLSNAGGGTVFGNNTTGSAGPAFTTAPVLGVPGTSVGTIALASATASGKFTITAPASSATPTLTLPTTSNVLAGQFAGDNVIYTSTLQTASAAGTLTPSLLTQTANTVLAGPTTGSAATPTFRTLVAADIPSGAVTWNAIGNATGSLTLANGTNTTTFQQTANTIWQWANTTTATSGTTNASPQIQLAANYWNGSASATDTWTLGMSLAAGTNGASTLTLSHSGSSGTAAVTTGIFNATTGFQTGGSATSAHYLRGNGTNFVSSAILIGDLPVSGTWAFAGTLSGAFTASGNVTVSGSPTFNTGTPAFQNSSVLFQNTNAATVSTTNGSTQVELKANYWTGSASATDTWTIYSQLSAGANAPSALAIQHLGGTSGATTVALYAGVTLGEYNGITTVGNGIPTEYATVNSTGNTANISSTTLYAVPSGGAGFYRVSAYLVETTAASTSSTLPSLTLTWLDETGTSQTATIVSGGSASNTVGTYARGDFTVYSEASQNISYATTGYTSVGGTSMAYSVRIRLEYLG